VDKRNRLRDLSALPLPACGERVGVRGLRRSRNNAVLRIAERPPHPCYARPLPARGERCNRNSFPRRDRARVMPRHHHAPKRRARSRKVVTGFRIRSCATKKGSGAPIGAPSIVRACANQVYAMCANSSAARKRALSRPARLSALRHGACSSERTPPLSPGRASREREDAGVIRTIDRA
jgi:hypothetical protein